MGMTEQTFLKGKRELFCFAILNTTGSSSWSLDFYSAMSALIDTSPLDLCLFVPCFPAFFDLLISLGREGLIILRIYNGPTFSKWPKEVGVLVHSTKSLQDLV